MTYFVFFVVLFVGFFIFLKFQKKTKESTSQFDLAEMHLADAKQAESEGDYLKARKEYQRAVRISQKTHPEDKTKYFYAEYEQFVKRDPIFKKLIEVFIQGIADNPDIRLSRLYFGIKEAQEWAIRYNYDGTITNEDIVYVLELGQSLGYFNLTTEEESRLNMASHHIERAKEAEKSGDYLGARVSYLQYVESLKQVNKPEELEKAKKEYEDFVRRDPVFNKLLPIFLEGIKQNPGILQSDITKKAENMEWGELRHYDRPLAKDDIRYVFYFAEEFGYLIRQKEGRSYRLYLPDQLKDVNEGEDRR